MYQLNLLPASNVITTNRWRTSQKLVGAKDGLNMTYLLPSGDLFVHNLPQLTLELYFNGQRLNLLDDYTISESGGVGTGYDTVTFLYIAPLSFDDVSADYYTEVVIP